MTEDELKERFKRFAINVYALTAQFPSETAYFKIKDQLIRCSSSAASNYRAACRGKSLSDFISKLGTVEEEIDESVFWLEYTNGVDKKWAPQTEPLIIVSSIKTAKKRMVKLKSRY